MIISCSPETFPGQALKLHVSALSTREAYLQDDPEKVPTWMNSIF